MVLRWIVILLIVAAGGAGIAVYRGILQIPSHYNPWAPLDLYAQPNFLTRHKLARLSRDPELCTSVLSQAPFAFEALSDRVTGPGCGFFNAVRIDRTSAQVGEPFSLSCRAAASLALWEIHVLQPAALRHLGSRVTRIEHYGSYSCRNVYGRPNATRSRHATAEALDLAGFVLEDGKRVRVLADWEKDEPAAQFLKEIRTGACAFFDAVLSPDYNAAHRDHLHFDRGPYRACR